MMSIRWTRSQRRRRTARAIAAVAPLLVCLVATAPSRPASAVPEASASAPAIAQRAAAKKLTVSPTRPLAGERTRFKGRLAGNGRPVLLQRKAGKKWATVDRGKVRKGRFGLATRVRKTGTYRVLAPAASGRSSYAKSKRVKVTKQRARVVTTAAPFVVGMNRTVTAEVLPARKGRKVQVQALVGSKWQAVASATSNGAGIAAITVRGTTPGTTSYRVVGLEHRGSKPSPGSPPVTVRTAPAVERLTNLVPGADAFDAAVSADGRWVAFASDTALLPSDVDIYNDVYLFDRATGALTHVLPETNNHTSYPLLSADGRFLALHSLSSNLASEPDYDYDVFVLDRQTGALDLVSATPDGEPGNDNSYLSSMTDDGRTIAFESFASDLVSAFPPPDTSVRLPWLHDRATGTTRGLGRIGLGWSDGNVFEVEVSPLGGLVTFVSSDEDLTDTAYPDSTVYAMDVAASGAVSNRRVHTPLARAYNPHLSSDGSVLAFTSIDELTPADPGGQDDAYVRRPDGSYGLLGPLGAGDTNAYGISASGRHVLVQTENPLPGDGNGSGQDVVLWDRTADAPHPVSAGGNGESYQPAMSGDASVVAFSSLATNFVPGSTTGGNLYIRTLR